jgi:hypothetical protein
MPSIRKTLVLAALATALWAAFGARSRAELGPAPEGSFSLIVLPDTQTYAARKPEIFHAETQWIVDNLQRQRIRFVSHVGDIVDQNVRPQWDVARAAMDRLHGKVPYGFSVGNHDMITKTGDSSLFQEYFPASRFEPFDWYVGQFGNNRNSVQVFSAEGLDFVIVHLECNAPDDALAWANGVLAAHSDRRAIVTTHMYLGPLEQPKTSRGWYDDPKGRMRWKKCHGARGNTPEQMWQKCFAKHANLFLICCGDQSRTQAMRRAVRGENGNTVHEVLSDYHEGSLRVYRFLPDADRIEAWTYRPHEGQLCPGTDIVPDPDEHHFKLPYEMGRGRRQGRAPQ